MCGVVGVIERPSKLVCQSQLKSMLSQLSHRGPDGIGYWDEGNVGIGHSRLSIIDPSDSASQPMVSYTILCNCGQN